MRRAPRLAVLVLAAVVATSCGDDDAPGSVALEGPISTRPASTTTATSGVERPETDDDEPRSPWIPVAEPVENAAGVPRLLVTSANGVHRVEGAVRTQVESAPDGAAAAVGDGAGLVVVEVREPDADGVPVGTGLMAIDGGAARDIPLAPHETVQLHDLVVIDGEPHVLYSLFSAPDDEVEESGTLYLHDLGDDATVGLATASAPELFLTSAMASTGAAVIALSYLADLTESVSFVDPNGASVERAGPTDDLAYNRPPFVTSAVPSADGTEIASLEGPDVDGSDPDGTTVGDWVVVIDDADGEQLRMTVADDSIGDVAIDFDGRWLVVSGSDSGGPVVPLLIDTEATDLAVYLIDLAGRARLDRA